MADWKRGQEHHHDHHQQLPDSPTKNHDEVASVDKKYGGLVPKKKPLISKQSAGLSQDPTLAVETLRPKLQKTPHQQLPPRKPACTSGRDSFGSS